MRTWLDRMVHLASALALAAALSAVPVAQVAACSCAAMTPDEAADAAEFAFTGIVVHIEPTDGKGMGVAPAVPIGANEPAIAIDWAVMGPTLFVFEVDGVAKGDVPPMAEVLAGGDGASCGMSFGMGERWLVFASDESGTISTNLCAGNMPLGAGEEPPIPVSAPSASPGESAGGGLPIGILVPVAVVAGLAGLSGYIFWRADRPGVKRP